MPIRRVSFRICVAIVVSLFSLSVFAFPFINGGTVLGSIDAVFSVVSPPSLSPRSFAADLAVRQSATLGVCDTAGPIEIESTGGTTIPTAYATLQAAFAAINGGTHTGVINIEVCGNTFEIAAATLNASGTGSSSYTSINIQPVGGARLIEGDRNGPHIDLSGADNVTIDGLNSGVNSLTLTNHNTASAANTIRFINDATNNRVQNCTILGSAIGASTGTIHFSTSSAGVTGNDSNIITENDIGPSATFPRTAIRSLGTATRQNSENQITNNNIFDFYDAGGTVANGVLLENSSAFTVTGK